MNFSSAPKFPLLQYIDVHYFLSVSARYLLSDLSPGVMADQWLNLVPVNPTTKAEGGTIRINAKYLHEVIMPIQEYKSLKEVTASSMQF